MPITIDIFQFVMGDIYLWLFLCITVRVECSSVTTFIFFPLLYLEKVLEVALWLQLHKLYNPYNKAVFPIPSGRQQFMVNPHLFISLVRNLAPIAKYHA